MIKYPMDLSTVKKKLKKNSYKKIYEVVSDLNLIWSNCKFFNVEGSDIYNSAVFMQQLCDRVLQDFLNLKSVEQKKKGRKKKEQLKEELKEEPKEEKMQIDFCESLDKKPSEILKEENDVE